MIIIIIKILIKTVYFTPDYSYNWDCNYCNHNINHSNNYYYYKNHDIIIMIISIIIIGR